MRFFLYMLMAAEYRRNFNLIAKVESSSSYLSFKSLVPGAFKQGFHGFNVHRLTRSCSLTVRYIFSASLNRPLASSSRAVVAQVKIESTV